MCGGTTGGSAPSARVVGMAPGVGLGPVNCYRSAYLAFNIAAKRAAFVFRRFLALGFSKRRCRRTCSRVCSRSSFFLNRRSALSTDSPFFSFTSVTVPSAYHGDGAAVRSYLIRQIEDLDPGFYDPPTTARLLAIQNCLNCPVAALVR